MDSSREISVRSLLEKDAGHFLVEWEDDELEPDWLSLDEIKDLEGTLQWLLSRKTKTFLSFFLLSSSSIFHFFSFFDFSHLFLGGEEALMIWYESNPTPKIKKTENTKKANTKPVTTKPPLTHDQKKALKKKKRKDQILQHKREVREEVV